MLLLPFDRIFCMTNSNPARLGKFLNFPSLFTTNSLCLPHCFIFCLCFFPSWRGAWKSAGCLSFFVPKHCDLVSFVKSQLKTLFYTKGSFLWWKCFSETIIICIARKKNTTRKKMIYRMSYWICSIIRIPMKRALFQRAHYLVVS